MTYGSVCSGRAYYNEHNAYAAEWLRNLMAEGLIAPGVVDERSIEDVAPDELAGYTQCHFFAGIGVWSYALRRAGWSDEWPVWTGSCPCQPFSAAGKGAGLTDERHLWPAWFHLIRVRRPGVVFGEQVASKDGRGWLDVVRPDLESEAYAVAPASLCAAGIGEAGGKADVSPAPEGWDEEFDGPWADDLIGGAHIRQRLYFVAHDTDERRERPADAWGWGSRTAHSGADRVMAYAERDGLHRAGGDETEPGGNGTHGGVSVGDGNTGGVAYNNTNGWSSVRRFECSGAECDSESRSYPGELASAIDALVNPRGISDSGAATGGGDRNGEGMEGVRGGVDWVLCRDPRGPRWRPVSSGTFPLAHGAPTRVGPDGSTQAQSRQGMLSGYGNAIHAGLAQTFIECAMEAAGIAGVEEMERSEVLDGKGEVR